MMLALEAHQQIWYQDNLIASSDEFQVGELFCLICELGDVLELRTFDDEGEQEICYIIGSPDDVARVIESHDFPHGSCAFLYLHGVKDLQGNDNIWSLKFQTSADGQIADGFMQGLWDTVGVDEIMSVDRSSEGEILEVEKAFIPNEDLDFLIYYDAKSNVIAITEFNHDSDDWLFEDIEPMLDDNEYYSNALALPARFGRGAQIPDISRFLVRRGEGDPRGL